MKCIEVGGTGQTNGAFAPRAMPGALKRAEGSWDPPARIAATLGVALVVGTLRMLGLVEAHDLVFLLHPETDGLVDDEGDDQGDDYGVGGCGTDRDQLDGELLDVAREKPGGSDCGEDAGQNGAGGAADAVHAEGVERVVVLELGFHQDAEVADQAPCDSHQDGGAGLHEARGGGDHDEARDHTGTEAESGGLAGMGGPHGTGC